MKVELAGFFSGRLIAFYMNCLAVKTDYLECTCWGRYTTNLGHPADTICAYKRQKLQGQSRRIAYKDQEDTATKCALSDSPA